MSPTSTPVSTSVPPAGEIARIGKRPERFVVIGAGKTALDTCVWLLEQHVPASAIRWIFLFMLGLGCS